MICLQAGERADGSTEAPAGWGLPGESPCWSGEGKKEAAREGGDRAEGDGRKRERRGAEEREGQY